MVSSPPRGASIVAMDTIVTAKVIGDSPESTIRAALDRALGWFHEVERVCSRFDRQSEVFLLSSQVGHPVQVSPMLFEAVRFGVEVATISGGLFDPTVGAAQALRGFDRNYATGERTAPPDADGVVSYMDVVLDSERQAITLRKPILIDLGALAKGMAIDLAAKELAGYESFCIDAGGDIYVKGASESGEAWRIGIEHPRCSGLIATLQVSQGAVCTSGDYERRRPGRDEEHHLLDPRTGSSPRQVSSCTVLAPTAMAADALSTAAFISGPVDGPRLLAEQGVDGMFVGIDLAITTTPGFKRWMA